LKSLPNLRGNHWVSQWAERRKSHLNPGVGIVIETLKMKKFSYNIRKPNISNVIYATKNFTQALGYLYIACRLFPLHDYY
jgi:hypothetical protein